MGSEAGMPASSTAYVTNNQNYVSESIMRIRLDTTKLLADLEAFYRGSRIEGYRENAEDGTLEPVFKKFGKARMNEEGIQDLMSWLTSMFNPSTVAGNKTPEEFGNFMATIHADIAENLMTNMHEYDIDERDYNGIVDKTIAAADMFFSRTIDNLERESYSNTMRSTETVGPPPSGWGRLNPFKGRGY